MYLRHMPAQIAEKKFSDIREIDEVGEREMQLEIEEEYKQFLEDIKDDWFVFGAYMDETEYEDEYSHNSIGQAMGELENRIKKYLHEKRSNEFIVYSDWCVHVMKREKASEVGMAERAIKNRIVR